jgi:hypothetical protein
MWNIQE